jgi:ribose 5-phosphate isomerase B
MNNKIIPIGCDHAGFKLKQVVIEYLTKNDIEVKDFGCFSEESIDYPDFAHPVANMIKENPELKGILLCGSGNGINMTANKHQDIRAALCWKSEIAELARLHNDANILTLPARFITDDEALSIVEVFLNTEFEGGRHAKRVDKISC